MILHVPVIITARLLPGVRVGNDTVSIEYSKRMGTEGRVRYRYHIDIKGKSYSGDDLQSGVGGGGLQDGLASLLSFLSAAGESYGYHMRHKSKGDNEDLFKPAVVRWAYEHSDDLAMLSVELEENPRLIEE